MDGEIPHVGYGYQVMSIWSTTRHYSCVGPPPRPLFLLHQESSLWPGLNNWWICHQDRVPPTYDKQSCKQGKHRIPMFLKWPTSLEAYGTVEFHKIIELASTSYQYCQLGKHEKSKKSNPTGPESNWIKLELDFQSGCWIARSSVLEAIKCNPQPRFRDTKSLPCARGITVQPAQAANITKYHGHHWTVCGRISLECHNLLYSNLQLGQSKRLELRS